MAKKDARTIHRELAQPFAAEDLGWRLQRTFEYHGKMTGIAVPYVTNRAIMNRLDKLAARRRVEELEEDVSMLKDSVKLLRIEVNELKKAQ